MKIASLKKLKKLKKHHFILFGKSLFWFLVGAFIALFLIINFSFFIFRSIYSNKIYPGVIVNGVDFGGKEQKYVKDYFDKKNLSIQKKSFTFTNPIGTATVSAKVIDFGYDSNLIAYQAYSIGRSKDSLGNVSLILQAYLNGLYLPPSYTFSMEKLKNILSLLALQIEKKPVDAFFTFENGRVSAFRESVDGQAVDFDELQKKINQNSFDVVNSIKPEAAVIALPIKILKPTITTEKVNNMGIKELIGSGTSLFQHSIPGRIFNVTLASTRLNGVLVSPGQVFSFNNSLGDVSAFTGYQQAYVIKDGKTVLGDGGGVCQVSTTLFRAALNAGLPIIERTAHAYRVGYYEEDGPPGIDATVYAPSPDLKFKNDTSHYILIQSVIDPETLRLTFNIYGTGDGRQVTMGKPVVTNETPPPPTLYQDDPTLPKGTLKQVDFAAWGANVYFTRQVIKNGKVVISEKYTSNYRPWQEVWLRGTKE